MLEYLIPAWKPGPFLAQAVASLVDQPAVVRVTVVDDACPEHCGAGLAPHPKVRVLRMRENGGQYRAINTGLRELLPDTQFVALLDADDTASPDRAAVSLATLMADPELAIVSGHRLMTDAAGQALPGHKTDSEGWDADPAVTLMRRCATGLHTSAATMRRSVLDVLGGFEPTWGGSDTDFVIRACYAGLKMRLLPDVLGTRRIHPGQVTVNASQDTVRQAFMERIRASWVWYRNLGRTGRLRPWHLKVAAPGGPFDVIREAEVTRG